MKRPHDGSGAGGVFGRGGGAKGSLLLRCGDRIDRQRGLWWRFFICVQGEGEKAGAGGLRCRRFRVRFSMLPSLSLFLLLFSAVCRYRVYCSALKADR